MEEDESWDRNDIVRVPQEELEQFIKFHLLKDYLERENHGWDLVIAATDLAIYMPSLLGMLIKRACDRLQTSFKKGPNSTLVDTRDDKSVFIPEWIHHFKLDVKKVRREEVKSQKPIQVKAPIAKDYSSE
ncbi:hypothetical protein TNCV_2827861 [Trichonephila clavipes]|nr:hypothetical protein TNCV_2827861 [Trichonephila clavipes]